MNVIGGAINAISQSVAGGVSMLLPHHQVAPDAPPVVTADAAALERALEVNKHQQAQIVSHQNEIKQLTKATYSLQKQVKAEIATQSLWRTIPAPARDAFVPLPPASTPVMLQASSNVLVLSFASPIDGQVIYVDDPYLSVEVKLTQTGTSLADNLPVYKLIQNVHPQTCLLRQKRPADTFSVSGGAQAQVAEVRSNTEVLVEQRLLVSSLSIGAGRSFLLKLVTYWNIPVDIKVVPSLSRYTIDALSR